MDTEKIRELAEIVRDYGLTSLDITEDGTSLSFRREPVSRGNAPAAPTESAESSEVYNFSDVSEIKAPMVGTFYASASPDVPSFVRIGSKVHKGDTLCIIEAMKLMNEITADCDGEIVDICVSDGDIVEYGQTLFKYIAG